jgi:hypothetical protein
MEKILEELAEVTYKAGYLHGQGLAGTPQHRAAAERSKELLQQLKKYIEQKASE